MCNIAGYIGRRPAAPILSEMMKRQEGFGGGYYTGITTHDGKNMHSVKVLGDMKNLLAETDCLSFPGTVGFLHSRSKSGGGIEWGQPYTSYDNNVSYIANGTFGYFLDEKYKKLRCDIAQSLEKEGVTFRSRCEGMVGNYPHLSDGTSIHVSDIVCQQIAYNINKGLTPDLAMSRAISENPGEIVGLIIEKNHPDSIFVTRVNFPMMIGVAEDGDTYIATTALAFPDDVKFKFIESLPAPATCEVFYGGYRVSGHKVDVDGVAPVTPDVWAKCYNKLQDVMADGKVISVSDAIRTIKPLTEGTLIQGSHIVYEIMRAFKNEGRLKVVRVEAEGAFDGYKTDNFHVQII